MGGEKKNNKNRNPTNKPARPKGDANGFTKRRQSDDTRSPPPARFRDSDRPRDPAGDRLDLATPRTSFIIAAATVGRRQRNTSIADAEKLREICQYNTMVYNRLNVEIRVFPRPRRVSTD